MKTNWLRTASAGLLGLCAVFSLTACGEDGLVGTSGTEDDAAVAAMMAMDLDLEDGGTDAANESPGFGDAYFDKYLQDEESAADPLENDPRFRRLENDNGASVFFVRLTWGNQSGAPEEGSRDSTETWLDWSGCASVSDGIVIPRRVLKFERGDHLLRPDSTTGRQKVCWKSKTGPAWDGVILQIVVPAAGDNTLTDARRGTKGDGLTDDDTFTFSAPEIPLELTFKLSELADLDEVILIDDVNGVSIAGFTRDDLGDRCPQGPMVGHWVRAENDERNGGFFRAKWANALGNLVGHVRGRWGVTEEGEQVFVGKIIGRGGNYLGHVRGTWESTGDGEGTMAGRWIVFGQGGEPRAAGGVRGEWRTGDREGAGLLRGKWAASCPDGDGGAE